jgi:hypothetical protein
VGRECLGQAWAAPPLWTWQSSVPSSLGQVPSLPTAPSCTQPHAVELRSDWAQGERDTWVTVQLGVCMGPARLSEEIPMPPWTQPRPTCLPWPQLRLLVQAWELVQECHWGQ